MSNDERPQIYLVTPPLLQEGFVDVLSEVLDTLPVACVRLALAAEDEGDIARAADQVRETCHARDVPVVIAQHGWLVERLGLDGVHLLDGARSVRKWRKELDKDAIIGAYCAASRHDGLNAGEAAADYVSFGPVRASDLGDGTCAPHDLFAWWSEVVEVPVVAEGAFDLETAGALASVVDFVALGREIWNTPEPIETLRKYIEAIG